MSILTSQSWIDPTRAIGLVAYATAFVSCSITFIRGRIKHRAVNLAAILMLIEGALLLDMAFNWRWELHQAIMDFALKHHEYERRGLPQFVAVILLGSLFIAGLIVVWRSLRHRGLMFLTVSGAMLSIALWCIEVVSLHAVDHLFYLSLLGVKAVSFLWVLSCTATSAGILLDPR